MCTVLQSQDVLQQSQHCDNLVSRTREMITVTGTLVIYTVFEYNYILFDVLQKEGGSTKIVDWDIKETLYFFLVEVHCDYMIDAYR